MYEYGNVKHTRYLLIVVVVVPLLCASDTWHSNASTHHLRRSESQMHHVCFALLHVSHEKYT